MKIFSRRDFLRLIAWGSASIAFENLLSACGLKPVTRTAPVPEIRTLPPDNEAEIIFTGGAVLTMDANNSIAEAIAIKGDSIIAVGTKAEVLKQRGTNTNVVDLQGHTLMPGFVDSHSHLGQNAQGDSGKFQELQDDAIRKGITTTTEMYVDADVMEQLKGYDQAGLMRMRWNTYLLYNTNCGDPVDHDWYKTYAQGEDVTPHIRNQGVKLFSDGGSCHVPAVSFEYPGGYGHGDLFLTSDQITAIVREVQESNHQIAIHALGDWAIEEAQNAIADSLNGAPNTYRHRIEHNAVLREDMLPRYNQVGIVPTLFGSYATCWMPIRALKPHGTRIFLCFRRSAQWLIFTVLSHGIKPRRMEPSAMHRIGSSREPSK